MDQAMPPAPNPRAIDADKVNSRTRLEMRMYREARATGFAHFDQQVCFFTQVAALLGDDDTVLDYGAGRGEWFHDDPVLYRRRLQNFRGRCAFVDGCDLDEAVLDNPTLDRGMVIKPGEPLPYEDDRFDLVVSRYVFEHVQDPEWTAAELLRVTRPGGWICAVTPNKLGYVALGSRLVPNRLHARLLRAIQPTRKEQDVFPTAYKLNTPAAIRRHFGAQADVYYYRDSAVPSYHLGKPLVFRGLQLLHRLLPPALGTGLFLFIRKRETA